MNTRALLYGVKLQWKLDFRNKGVLLTYYVIPLIFFAFMGGIFSSINPGARQSLTESMTIFGVSMGALLGMPPALAEHYGTEIVKAYRVGHIPLWSAAVNHVLSAALHLFTMSLLILVTAPIVFNANVPTHLGYYLIFLVGFLLSSLLVGTALALSVKNTRLSMAAQLVFLPSIMLSGIMFPASMLPEVLQTAGKIFPAAWALQGMRADQLQPSALLPLVAIGTVAMLASGLRIKMFRKP